MCYYININSRKEVTLIRDILNLKETKSLYINGFKILSLQNVNLGGGIYSTKVNLSIKNNKDKQYTTKRISIIIKNYINLFKSYIFLLEKRLIF